MQKFSTAPLSILHIPDYNYPINPHTPHPHLRRPRAGPPPLFSPRPYKPQSFVPIFTLAADMHRADLRQQSQIYDFEGDEGDDRSICFDFDAKWNSKKELRDENGQLLWRYEPREAIELSEEEAREVRERLDLERRRGREGFKDTLMDFYARREAATTASIATANGDGVDENTRIGGGRQPASKRETVRRFFSRRKENSGGVLASLAPQTQETPSTVIMSSSSSIRSLATIKDGLRARLFRVRVGNMPIEEDEYESRRLLPDPPATTNSVDTTTSNHRLTRTTTKVPLQQTSRHSNPFASVLKKKPSMIHTSRVWNSGTRFSMDDDDEDNKAVEVEMNELVKGVENIGINSKGLSSLDKKESSGWFSRRSLRRKNVVTGENGPSAIGTNSGGARERAVVGSLLRR